MERTDFDYDPKRDKTPNSITYIILALALAAAIYLSFVVV
jgi:hypothetical protein